MKRQISNSPWLAGGSALISLLTNFSIETSLIFLPLFAQSLGASRFEIGIIAASYGLAYFASSWIFGRQSDLSGRLIFIRIGMGTAIVALGVQVFATNPLILMLVRALVGLCLGMSTAALMAYNFEVGGNTGKLASLGSLGWLLGDSTASFIHNFHTLFLLGAAASGIAFIVSMLLREPQNRYSLRPNITQVTRRNLRIYFSFFLRQLGANMVWFILPLFMVSLGANETWIAILSAINSGGQFIAMMLVDRFREKLIFTLGFILSAIVFLAYSVSGSYLQLIPAQAILAISWSCLYVGALLILLRSNEESATATGVFFSVISIAGVLGPFLGGIVSQFWGYPPLMYIAAGLSLGGLVVALIPQK
jgi:MFS family permease